jgi:hypothetical protein
LYGGAEAKVNKTVIIQADDPILNNTDYNRTIGQISPNLKVTIAPRITIEYGDYAITRSLNPNFPPFQIQPRIITEYTDTALQLGIETPLGLNTTGITPRIIVEYADYVAFTVPCPSYTGPQPIPEFPLITILPLFMLLILLIAVILRRSAH